MLAELLQVLVIALAIVIFSASWASEATAQGTAESLLPPPNTEPYLRRRVESIVCENGRFVVNAPMELTSTNLKTEPVYREKS